MTALEALRRMGQSIWLDDASRELLEAGTLSRYIAEFSVTGLTSNPTILERAIGGSDRYDDAILTSLAEGLSPEQVFSQLALADVWEAARVLLRVHDALGGLVREGRNLFVESWDRLLTSIESKGSPMQAA